MTSKEMARQPLRLMVVEDHELSRNGIIVSLQKKSSFDIVADADQGDEAVRLAETVRPDVILMDIELPVMDGIAATKAIKQALGQDVKIIMLTSHDDREMVLASLTAGADGYCIKDINVDRLIQVVEMVCDGAIWMDPAIARIVVDTWKHPGASSQPGIKHSFVAMGVTERELEILQDIVDGKSNQEIAEHLCISLHTVKTHVRNIIEKLAVSDRTQAAVKAIRTGLVQLD